MGDGNHSDTHSDNTFSHKPGSRSMVGTDLGLLLRSFFRNIV